MRQVRTDLAMEAANSMSGLPGVTISSWEEGDAVITEVRVDTGEGASILGKDPGVYITVETQAATRRDVDARKGLCALLGEEISRMLPQNEAEVLVIGLGNSRITPDSLGPRVVEKTLVTRHIQRKLPESMDERMGLVCAIAPGVLGVTGVETIEMARGIIAQVRPNVVIAIDALAARSTDRVGNAIQLTDTGIQPGSGVGNHQSALTEKSLGVKVLAIGVPTVIYAHTMISDALEILSGKEQEEKTINSICEKLSESPIGELVVTPREIDEMIDDIAQVLAEGINLALHNGLSSSDIAQMMG
ncbi:MAG: GPR endopeptidase [Clostridia bacterium]|nr:GPR endopeptidase [Clostridia bacterium]